MACWSMQCYTDTHNPYKVRSPSPPLYPRPSSPPLYPSPPLLPPSLPSTPPHLPSTLLPLTSLLRSTLYPPPSAPSPLPPSLLLLPLPSPPSSLYPPLLTLTILSKFELNGSPSNTILIYLFIKHYIFSGPRMTSGLMDLSPCICHEILDCNIII